ncbi:MAG: hypothetical protein Q7S92_05235 [Candidatus Diapherotrites archaeon]|nr:hypothetical protein [Candidatus Diapherotrites archaeon]
MKSKIILIAITLVLILGCTNPPTQDTNNLGGSTGTQAGNQTGTGNTNGTTGTGGNIETSNGTGVPIDQIDSQNLPDGTTSNNSDIAAKESTFTYIQPTKVTLYNVDDQVIKIYEGQKKIEVKGKFKKTGFGKTYSLVDGTISWDIKDFYSGCYTKIFTSQGSQTFNSQIGQDNASLEIDELGDYQFSTTHPQASFEYYYEKSPPSGTADTYSPCDDTGPESVEEPLQGTFTDDIYAEFESNYGDQSNMQVGIENNVFGSKTEPFENENGEILNTQISWNFYVPGLLDGPATETANTDSGNVS